MSTAVTVDVAGGPMGGAARFRTELYSYLERTGRTDIGIIGAKRCLNSPWLVLREALSHRRTRRVALNNVGFLTPGGERWTLLGNALHFLTESEISSLDPSLHMIAKRQAAVVRLAARRSDVLIAPCSAMAERVAQVMPSVKSRLTVRMHPVSPSPAAGASHDHIILCPIIFEAYKHMPERIAEWLAATEGRIDTSIKLVVTASHSEVPTALAHNPRIHFVGRLDHSHLRSLWARSRAIYFPTGLESFGFPLAEARASGLPAIARDTPQNQEIAGPALCGFSLGDTESLLHATEIALTKTITPNPDPFDATAYFEWMLGSEQ